MRDFKGKRYWLIGASEGLGRALASELAQAGADVIVSARSAHRLRDLVAELPGTASYDCVDVSDTNSVRMAAERIGEIDGMVYLAGVYWPLGADEWDADKNETMTDINYGGAVRSVGAVLPGMLKRGAGHVVLTGSLSGFRGLPGAVGYGASKAAIMYMAEAMHADLRGTGIDVQLVNPGFIKTRLTDKNDFKMPFIMTPETAAEKVMAHMRSSRFKRNFPWGFGAMFRASQFLPDFLYYRLLG